MRDVSDMLNIKELICIDIIFIDASNAFDSVPHNELLKELQSIGIFGVFLKLLVDYFTNRFQYVKYDNFNSFLYEVMSGVLQGGVLSPILYNIFVRNFPLVLKYSKPFQFADDTAIIKGILSENDLNNFQIDIYEISKWFESKGLTINASKTKHLRISIRNIQLKTYTINNSEIEVVQSHRHLGIIIDSKLSFNQHIDLIVNKALKNFSMLKRLCPRADGNTFLKMYKTYILSILENCNLGFYTNLSNTNRIESVQKKVTRFICNKLGKYLNYEQRLKYLKLNTLQNRKLIRGLNILKRIKDSDNLLPQSWLNSILFHNSRNGIVIKIPKTRIKKCDQQFFIRISKEFNDLPKDIRNSITQTNFIKNVKIFKLFN
jgi:hypothetical protein